MPRFAAFLMVLVLLAGSAMGAALAQEQPAAAPRYVFVPVETGALRLHTGTGEVSLCEGGNGAGACTALADERSAAGSVAADMAELEKRVAALEARVAEL